MLFSICAIFVKKNACYYSLLHKIRQIVINIHIDNLIIANNLLLNLIAEPPEHPSNLNPCSPSPCGSNAYCRERNNVAVCECLPDYRGDPYLGCQPECLLNSDCPKSQACVKTKCQDPCVGTCGINAICTVSNHIPICSCRSPTIGDAFTHCFMPEGNSIKYLQN